MLKTSFVGRGWQKYHTDGENREKYRSCSWKVSRLELDRQMKCDMPGKAQWVFVLWWHISYGSRGRVGNYSLGSSTYQPLMALAFFLFTQYEIENNF